MATLSVVYNKLANSPADFISSHLDSVTLASGATTAASTVEWTYVMLTAMGGNMWVAFSTDGTAPVASADPRIPVPQMTPMIVAIKAGTRITAIDMV